MDIASIKLALKDHNLKAVSRTTGVSYSAIRKIMNGRGETVSVRTATRLSNYLEGIAA
jgi:DNA-binding Xre family transcriptional regulator